MAWADPVGQAGIEFLALSQRSRRGLKEWIFIQLLTAAQQLAESQLRLRQGTRPNCYFPRHARPAIRFEPEVKLLHCEGWRTGQRPSPLHLPWFPFAISAHALAYLVDGLILLSACAAFRGDLHGDDGSGSGLADRSARRDRSSRVFAIALPLSVLILDWRHAW